MMALMDETATAVDRIRAERVVAILRGVSEPDRVVGELFAGGIRVVEITLDSDQALETIARLRRNEELTVLAGTVRTSADAEAAAGAGAQACVAPALVPEMLERCSELGVPAVPGAVTPTEIEAAVGFGVELVKLFPAGVLGAEYLRAVLEPLRGVALMVTGGVDAANAREFLDAGAVAVGIGSALTGAGDVGAEARRVVAAVR
jgi:2-dehydro-3-deoxyphosphogluconate aldolase / (4S)-4-hydroxy-2-oxoglutarate aldolase